MTVERGIDPRDLVLLAFGGAGPLHGVAIADELDMRTVLVPRASGVLSAVGLIAAERRRDLVESVLLAGDDLEPGAIAEVVERLAERGRHELSEPDAEVRAGYDLRYAGQAFELTIDSDARPDVSRLRESFEAAHRERYGYVDSGSSLELVTVRVAVALPATRVPDGRRQTADGRGSRRARFAGEEVEAAVVRGVPESVAGPAIVELEESTVVVPPGWTASADAGGLRMERR
jgi:N-methylhydantoinase A